MPYNRPNLTRLKERTASDTDQQLQNGGARVEGTFEHANSIVLSGVTHGLHGHIETKSRMVHPYLAEGDDILLWAAALGVERNDASKAAFDVQVTGTNGSTLPEGHPINFGGVAYVTTAELELPASGSAEGEVEVEAVLAGAAGNRTVGDELSLGTPQAGIDSTVIVIGTAGQRVGGGADQETLAALKVRYLERMADPPAGGTEADYKRWAKEISGVTRVWPIKGYAGPGSVVVLFVMDEYDEDGNFTVTTVPNDSVVEDLQDLLDDGDHAPMGATAIASAPIATALSPVIELEPNTAEVRAQVTAQLNDLLLRESNKPGSTVFLSQINEAISLAPGETNHSLVSPTADIELGPIEILVLGTPTYSDL